MFAKTTKKHQLLQSNRAETTCKGSQDHLDGNERENLTQAKKFFKSSETESLKQRSGIQV